MVAYELWEFAESVRVWLSRLDLHLVGSILFQYYLYSVVVQQIECGIWDAVVAGLSPVYATTDIGKKLASEVESYFENVIGTLYNFCAYSANKFGPVI